MRCKFTTFSEKTRKKDRKTVRLLSWRKASCINTNGMVCCLPLLCDCVAANIAVPLQRDLITN